MEEEYWVADGDGRLGRWEIEALGAKGAGALRALGVGPDDVVAAILRNDLVHCALMRAAALAEAVLCPLNWHGAEAEVRHILDDCKAKVVVVHRDLIAPIAGALEGRTVVAVTPGPALCAAYRVSPEAAADRADLPEWADLVAGATPVEGRPRMRPMMRYTSGSTGRPKGIRREPRGDVDYYTLLRRPATEMMQMRPGARFLTAAPLYHSAPSTLSAMVYAMEEISMFVAPRFEAEAFLATIERERITHIYLVPTMMARMLKLPDEVKARYDVSSVEFCISTGSPWPHEIKMAMVDWWGPVFWETYGASELGFLTLVSSELAREKPGTAGTIQMGGSILILDDEGEPLPPGELGTIYVRFNAFGDFDYTNEPESRIAAEKHGHISVGDMGWLDEDGCLFVADRKKDMIISGGANIFPAEIEAALIEAPFVADVAVFGAPHEEFGEQIVAAIQPAEGATPSEADVTGWLDGRLARMKHPRIVAFHAALPRHDSGKIMKPALKAPYWEGSGRRI